MRRSVVWCFYLFSLLLLTACEPLDLRSLSAKAKATIAPSVEVSSPDVKNATLVEVKPFEQILDEALASAVINNSFKDAIKSAVQSDPIVLGAKAKYSSSVASINVVQSLKDFQLSGTLYGGVEDLTDETSGIAAVLSANKTLYDGGKLDGQILAEQFAAKAAFSDYEAKLNERAFEASAAWVNLDRYESLSGLIGSRLDVLDPLITQLEKVASAGLGDATQVAAAQRTVALIRVTQTDVEERLEQARVTFINIFGGLPKDIDFPASIVSDAVPVDVSKAQIMQAPALRANYATYSAAVANLQSIKAQDAFNVGFETRIQKPFGGSSYDSDESIGLVVQKTFFDGHKLESEIKLAEEQAKAQLEFLKATYRSGNKMVKTAYTTISSMKKAIKIANDIAANAVEEISYLRKQLIIGQSTLDSVLSAEARLYDAESKEINFVADRRIAQLSIISSVGELANLFEIE
jgi:outer membrane protein TolC